MTTPTESKAESALALPAREEAGAVLRTHEKLLQYSEKIERAFYLTEAALELGWPAGASLMYVYAAERPAPLELAPFRGGAPCTAGGRDCECGGGPRPPGEPYRCVEFAARLEEGAKYPFLDPLEQQAWEFRAQLARVVEGPPPSSGQAALLWMAWVYLYEATGYAGGVCGFHAADGVPPAVSERLERWRESPWPLYLYEESEDDRDCDGCDFPGDGGPARRCINCGMGRDLWGLVGGHVPGWGWPAEAPE